MKTIRTKMMLIMFIAALIIISVLDVVAINAISKTTKDTLSSSTKPLSAQGAKNFNNSVEQYITDLSQGVRASSFQTAENEAAMIGALRYEFPENVRDKVDYAVFGETGETLYTTDGKKSDVVDKADIERSIKFNEVVVGDIKTISTGKQIFYILRYVKTEEKRVAVAVEVDVDELGSVFVDDAAGENGFAFVIDDNGDIVISTETNVPLEGFNANTSGEDNKEFKSLASAAKEILAEEGLSGEFSYDGRTYIFGSSNTDYFGSKIVYALTPDDFSDATSVTLRNIIIITVVMLVLTILCSIFYSMKISKPIVSATTRIRQLAQGNLSAPVDVWYSKDELGVLTSSLEETIVCLRQYITLITVALNQISEGNLCHRMEGTFKGDFQQIKNTFNEILNSLSDTFASINTAAEQVNSGAIQVSNSAQSVSQGSTQQASAIEELSVTISDVAKQVEQNAADARGANDLVSKTAESVNSCNNDMTNMLGAIDEIRISSEEISKIIKVIDEIAFQTNILALNAAVEAAREGSKGFGVVADEVRRLASRSAEAAKQTASLIENSVNAVSKGSQIAEKTAQSLGNIVEGTYEIQKLVENITEASEDQTEAIAQINTGLAQISSVVSANTSATVGTASASEELSSQSLILKNMIARFKLSEELRPTDGVRKFDYSSDFDDFDGDTEVGELADDTAASDSAFEGFVDDEDDKY